MRTAISHHFSNSYLQAREKFMAAATCAELTVQPNVLRGHHGAEGEELSMDVVRVGAANARSLLIVSSGLHGVEGFCGSGCQVALLHDNELLLRLAQHNAALLLVHAVNPYGFSHLQRTNESNIDLNRNFIDFSQVLPINDAYADVHSMLLPAQWPASSENAQALERYVSKHGEIYFKDAVWMGQHTHPDGMFYMGRSPAWSNTTLRKVIRTNGAGFERVGWIDIHTGLGPWGHGEKIFASHQASFPGQHDPAEKKRARAFWGADVFSIFDGQSASRNSRGGAISCLPAECPTAVTTTVGLECGTVALDQVTCALRAVHWLANHPECDAAKKEQIKSDALACFYVATPEWMGMVYAQTRVMVLQGLTGLSSAEVLPA